MNHNVIMEDRKKLTFSGIKDVLNFDEETVILDTVLGKMTVKGAGLHMIHFNNETGDLVAQGRVFAIVYTSEEKSEGFFSRLFR